MKIAIIGAGFTGLAAAWKLSQHQHQVTIFEGTNQPGGLAAGLSHHQWQWTLEHHYHHIFTSDKDIINLTHETHFSDQVIFTTSKTSVIHKNQLYPFDSPASLIKFPHLSLASKLKTALTLAFLKLTPTWKILEKTTAEAFIKHFMGNQAWKILWRPLFTGKFGQYSNGVNAAWFWARIKVRSKKLGYFLQGFQHFANHLAKSLKDLGVQINYNTKVKTISSEPDQIVIKTKKGSTASRHIFDKVLITTTSPVFTQLVTSLPKSYVSKLAQLKGLAAQTLIIELNRPFFSDGTYWLNVNQKDWPMLAIVEHTNFMPKKHYGNKHLLYIGRYLPTSDNKLTKTKKQLISEYLPYLNQINPQFKSSITNSWKFTSPFAQPITPINHSQNIPAIKTPINNVYWASMQHIYPFDRGINYAVKIGNQAADILMHD